MKKNVSPWIYQLNHARTRHTLDRDLSTNVAIIGAGIAGISTAFFILKNTDKNVVVLERHKLAHGATGHNAGQVVSYFERSFSSMVEEFGLAMTSDGHNAIDGAWALLDEMYADAELDIPFSRFTGHDGLSSIDHILWYLKNMKLRKEGGLSPHHVYISKLSGLEGKIPKEYDGLYTVVAQKVVQEMLETKLTDFVAAVSDPRGCINSALFCQEVVAYLQRKYPDRFALYENTPVNKALLREEHGILDASTHIISAEKIVLCTNGFENLRIINEAGLDIDAKYHYLVSGKVSYMSGYLEKMNKPPIAIEYYIDPEARIDDPYFYLTRRPYEYEKNFDHNLISVGGLDVVIEETKPYSIDDAYPEDKGALIDAFIRKIYSLEPNNKIDYVFTWHGLMGYTKHGVRMVGEEPQNKTLLYNLGCNGIGILPSIYGGKKISQHVAGEVLPPSIFDIPARGK